MAAPSPKWQTLVSMEEKKKRKNAKCFIYTRTVYAFWIRYWWRNGSVIRIMRHYGVRPLPNALLKCSPGLSFCIIHPNKHNGAAVTTEHLAHPWGACNQWSQRRLHRSVHECIWQTSSFALLPYCSEASTQLNSSYKLQSRDSIQEGSSCPKNPDLVNFPRILHCWKKPRI